MPGMSTQGKPPGSTNSLQRVKVYQLNDSGKWDDQGTGHVTVDHLQGMEHYGLIVIDEEENDSILVHRISSDEIYRRQEDTIISWRDPEFSTELALSFQESTGCSYIWDQICGVQRNLHFNTLSHLEVGPRPAMEAIESSGASQSNDDSFSTVNNELRELPSLEQTTLPLILKTVVESGVTDQMRVAELLVQDQDFFPKLVDLFRMSEDLEDMDSLHMIFRLVKGIILLNSPQIFDRIFGDELILDIIGALEYDPDVRQVQSHRTYLKEHVIFKEAIPIKNSLVLSKIHQTYRVGYLKDAILPRVLDESTIASLNTIIHSNNANVVSLLKDDTSFIQELFARMRSDSTSAESKKDLVLFLQEFCALSKSLQLVQQLRLFRDLANEGIFDIITDTLQNQDRKLVSAGADILILFLNHDPGLLRSYIIQQDGNTLLRLLVKGMITDFGEDMHCQFLEIIRILLDSYTLSGSQANGALVGMRYSGHSESHPRKDFIIEIFYEKHLDQLIDVITSSCPPRSISQTSGQARGKANSHVAAKPEILSNICELLCFCVLHHPFRIKCNFLMNNVIEKVLYLTRRREKYLVAATVRFMRAIISRNDDHLLRHIVKNNLLKPIIDAFIENGNRDNLLHSGVLDLLEYIRKENLKALIVYVFDNFWDQLLKFGHLGSIQAFKTKYEQSLESCDIKNTVNATDSRKRVDERALEKEEEDYFNEDSDEEDSTSAHLLQAKDHRTRPTLSNGSGPSFRPGSGGLVDYEDDDDDDDYNPPPRKLEAASGDGRSPDSSKSKRKLFSKTQSRDEEPEVSKKQRVEQCTTDGKMVVAAACSTSSRSDSPSKSAAPGDAGPSPADRNNDSNDHSDEKETAETRSSCSSVPEAADTRQSSGEDGPLAPVSSSSPDKVVSGANSEPYSVR